MVIDNLYLVRIGRVPTKADAVLIVDPDAPLANSVAGQLLEPVSRKAEISDLGRSVELNQLSSGYILQRLEPLRTGATGDRSGLIVGKASNHLV